MEATSARDIIVDYAIKRANLPRSMFLPYADLDGTEARRFLAANGFEVVASGDTGRYGFAQTACGIKLFTNGYICHK